MKFMNKTRVILLGLLVGVMLPLTVGAISTPTVLANANDGNNCGQVHEFLGLLPWYGYLGKYFYAKGNTPCGFHINFLTEDANQNTTGISVSKLNAIWLIALAVFEDLIRIAGMVTLGMVIYGGVRYMTSSGVPEETSKAQNTIISAAVGLAIAVIAATTVQFLAHVIG